MILIWRMKIVTKRIIEVLVIPYVFDKPFKSKRKKESSTNTDDQKEVVAVKRQKLITDFIESKDEGQVASNVNHEVKEVRDNDDVIKNDLKKGVESQEPAQALEERDGEPEPKFQVPEPIIETEAQTRTPKTGKPEAPEVNKKTKEDEKSIFNITRNI